MTSTADPTSRAELSAEELELLTYLLEEAAIGTGRAKIRKRGEMESVPLSYAQERLWLLDQWEPENPSYSYPLALYLSGSLDGPALQQVLDKVACRHAVLRASFPAVDGRLVSVVQPGKPLASSVAGTACRRSL